MAMRLTKALAAFLLCALSTLAHAQGDYPRRPVTIIVPASVGSAPDVVTRIVAEDLGRLWKQSVIVVNRPGGGGVIALQAMATVEPDGHTLFMAIASTLLVLPETQPRLPLDVDRNLAPIGLVSEQPLVVAVNPRLGVGSMAELVELARSRPGGVLVGTAFGSIPHMVCELLRSRGGVDMTIVPSIQARAVQDTIGGTLGMVVENLASIAPSIQNGLLKPLAVARPSRLESFPDIPTLMETLPEIGEFDASGWTLLMAPGSLSADFIQKLGDDLQTVLNTADLRNRFTAVGTYTKAMSPGETAAFVRAQREIWRPTIKRIWEAR